MSSLRNSLILFLLFFIQLDATWRAVKCVHVVSILFRGILARPKLCRKITIFLFFLKYMPESPKTQGRGAVE